MRKKRDEPFKKTRQRDTDRMEKYRVHKGQQSEKRDESFKRKRQRATVEMEKYIVRKGLQSEMFWAQLDTLCQTMPWVPKEEREEMLNHLWVQWMKSEIPDSLLDYYEGWMCAFYIETEIRNKEHLYAQAGSLIAKMEWVDPDNYGMTVKQMYQLCVEKMEQLPRFDGLKEEKAESSRNMLFNILKHYGDANGMCSEQVRSFFMDHYPRYEDALQILMGKLHTKEGSAEKESSSRQEDRPNSTSRQGDDVIHSQDDTIGLFTFVEKTSSPVYQHSLSRLYGLYQKPAEEVTGKQAQMYLRDFFSALAALGIEPVDEETFRTEYPQEYSKELQRRSSDPNALYTMASCGWSCHGYLVAYPVFYKK